MNRPQYYYRTPRGYKDVPFVRPVNFDQDPPIVIPVGGFLNDYIIQMDNGEPQLIRSLFVLGPNQDTLIDLQMRLRDAFGNELTDGYVPLVLFASGAGETPPDGGSGRTKVFEPELYCPAGSTLILDLYNPGPTPISLGG